MYFYVDVWKDFIEGYCKDDVKILGLSVYKHQEIFENISIQLLREQQLKRYINHLWEYEQNINEKWNIVKETKKQ